MAQLVISGKELIRLLEKLGFEVIRVNGSHHRVKHPDAVSYTHLDVYKRQRKRSRMC